MEKKTLLYCSKPKKNWIFKFRDRQLCGISLKEKNVSTSLIYQSTYDIHIFYQQFA